MFKSKQFLFLFIVETVMPWLTAVIGLFAILNFHSAGQYYRQHLMDDYEKAEKLFETFYRMTMTYGVCLLIALFVIGFVAFIMMLVRLLGSKKEKYIVARPLIIWIYSGVCMVGTLLLILLTAGFTYGMSV